MSCLFQFFYAKVDVEARFFLAKLTWPFLLFREHYCLTTALLMFILCIFWSFSSAVNSVISYGTVYLTYFGAKRHNANFSQTGQCLNAAACIAIRCNFFANVMEDHGSIIVS